MVQFYDSGTGGTTCGNTVTWKIWTADTISADTTNGLSSGAWVQWNHQFDTGTSSSVTCASSSATAWQFWVNGCPAGTITVNGQTHYQTFEAWSEKVEETAAQKAERRAREEARKAELAEMARQNAIRAEQAQKERMEAEARAEVLLLENLEEEERNRYLRAGYFYVFSKSGKKYKVKKGTHGNVYLMDPITDREQVRYCVQPGGVPVGDANLAQALFLKHAEEEFLAKANATRLYN